MIDLRVGECFVVEDNLSNGDKVDKYYECVRFDDLNRCWHCSLGMTSPICAILYCEGKWRRDKVSVVFVEVKNVRKIKHRYRSKPLPGFRLHDGKIEKQGDMNEEYEHGDYNEVPQRDKEVENWLNYKKCAEPEIIRDMSRGFDLEAALNGAKIRTRCGYPARIICTDRKGPYPVVALLGGEGEETVCSYTVEGRSNVGAVSNYDLVMAPEKRYINIFQDKNGKYHCSKKSYQTEEMAKELEGFVLRKYKGCRYVETVEIEE